MRTLLGGIVGGVAAGSAWLAAEHFTHSNLFWMVVLVGLVTGLSVHRAGGSSKRLGTARGALALALTMAVIVGGRQLYVKFMQSTIDPTAIAQAIVTEEQILEDDPVEEAVESQISQETPQTLEIQSAPMGSSGRHQPSIKQHFSEWDMVWMSLAALAAYISGKGGEKPSLVETAEQPPEDSSMQESAVKEDEG